MAKKIKQVQKSNLINITLIQNVLIGIIIGSGAGYLVLTNNDEVSSPATQTTGATLTVKASDPSMSPTAVSTNVASILGSAAIGPKKGDANASGAQTGGSSIDQILKGTDIKTK